MLNELFIDAALLGLVLTLGAYELGASIQRRTHFALANPLALACAFVIAFLLIGRVEYSSYYAGAKYISFLLTPATVCLALPLYRKLSLLKRNALAIAGGTVAGVAASGVSILVFSRLFSLEHSYYATLLPKSVTTAIGLSLSEELGGIPSLTAACIILTGILGNILAQGVCRILRIRHPIAKGIAVGCSSHVIGTTRAMSMGEIEGAMSSLATVLAGLFTVVSANLFIRLY